MNSSTLPYRGWKSSFHLQLGDFQGLGEENQRVIWAWYIRQINWRCIMENIPGADELMNPTCKGIEEKNG